MDTDEQDSLQHIESLIATVRRHRTELYWEYHELMEADSPDTLRLNALATARIRATKTLQALNIRMVELVDSQDY